MGVWLVIADNDDRYFVNIVVLDFIEAVASKNFWRISLVIDNFERKGCTTIEVRRN